MISVIMPVYNVEDYVAEAIESVRQQSYGEWELLLIDDGSTVWVMFLELFVDMRSAPCSLPLLYQKRKWRSILSEKPGAAGNGRRMDLFHGCG